MKHLQAYLWVYLIALVLLVNLGLVYKNFLAPAPQSNDQPTTEQLGVPAGMVESSLNGEYIPEARAQLPTVAVMIDNYSAGARPAAGLSKASVVWETLVEGGVTRLMPIFQTDEDVTIGPVRSARDYYLPWAKEAQAMYAHSGGSVAGLAALKADPSIPNADEFFNGGAFYRAAGSAAPHNLFTSMKRMLDLARVKNWYKEPSVSPLVWSDEAPSGDKANKVRIDFSVPAYRAEWTFDEETKLYRRVQGGAIAIDRNTKQQLTAKTVVVLFAEVRQAPPPAKADAVVVSSVGSGEAWVFRDGVLIKGRWSKAKSSDRVSFTSEGKSIGLARGTIWFEVVDKAKTDSVKVE